MFQNLCSIQNYPSQLSVNLLLHFFILFVVLSVLFLTYVSRIIDDGFNGALDDALKNVIGSIDMSDDQRALFRLFPQHLLTQEDPVKSKNNKWLKNTIFLFIVGILLVILCVLFTVYKNCKQVDLPKILAENAITFLLVGTVEFLFFFYIVKNYIPIKPSMMKSYVLKKIAQA